MKNPPDPILQMLDAARSAGSLAERRPTHGWVRVLSPEPENAKVLVESIWARYGVTVVSRVILLEWEKDGIPEEGLFYHVKIEGAQGVPTRNETRQAIRDFALDGFQALEPGPMYRSFLGPLPGPNEEASGDIN